MPRYLLDTNPINEALDQNIEASRITQGEVFSTHIQPDELHATNRAEGRMALPTAAAAWNVSKWNEAEWGNAGGAYTALLNALNLLNGSKTNNVHDVLIGATAIARGLTLVSDDIDLVTAVRELGGNAIPFAEFIA